jgi:hypothetical protein
LWQAAAAAVLVTAAAAVQAVFLPEQHQLMQRM